MTSCGTGAVQYRRRSSGDNDVHSPTHQLGCGLGDLRRTLRQGVLDDEVLALDKPQFVPRELFQG